MPTKATHFSRHFSTFPVEVKAPAPSRDHSDTSSLPKIDDSEAMSSSEPLQVENIPLHAALSPDDDEAHVQQSELGMLLGVDRSLIQYMTDVQELEKLVSIVESCSSLTCDDLASYIHPIMLATSKLHSVEGANLTERLLAKCLRLSETTSDITTVEEYMNLPFPSAEMYNMAIGSWTRAQSRDCTQRATQLLTLMSQEYQRGSRWVKEFNAIHGGEPCRVRAPRPDIINYTAVMNAWCKQGTKGVLQAQQVLQELEHLSGVSHILSTSGDENRTEYPLAYLTPDQACYNAVITGWARSSNHDACSQIEALLDRMDALHERTGDSRFEPDTRSFQMLITAYAKAAQQRREKTGNQASLQAAIQAESVLRVMVARYDEARRRISRESSSADEAFAHHVNVEPDVMVYNAVLSAFANSASLEGAQRAESILFRMLGEARNDLGDFPLIDGIMPNIITFNTVINAVAKSGDSEAGSRAEKLLDVMKSLELSPNTVTFNALMNAWSRSNAPDAVERIDSIFRVMIEEGGEVRPNVISFSTAIFAVGRSEDDDGALRAEQLLNQMETMYAESNDKSLRPNKACYDGVIFAWLNRSGNKKQYDGLYAAERAEAILLRMKDVGCLTPMLKQYNRVLNAWCKHESVDASEIPNKVERARALVQEMSSNANDGSKRERVAPAEPDVFSYNYVIATCASCANQGAERRREAFFSALETYNRLCECNECHPNNHTYRMMFDVCANLLPKSSNAQVELMEKLFRECCEDGLLSNDILRTLRKYLPQSTMQKILGPDVVVEERKPIYPSDLPREWSRNFGPKGRSR